MSGEVHRHFESLWQPPTEKKVILYFLVGYLVYSSMFVLYMGFVHLQVIQHDVGSELFLYAPKNKVGEAEHVATVALGQLTRYASSMQFVHL